MNINKNINENENTVPVPITNGPRNVISSHLGLPLTPGLAREIIEELFQHQRLWTTGVLIEKVPQEHRQKGGIEGRDTIKNVINKALGYLREDGCIQKPFRKAYGVWEWIGSDPDAEALAPASLSVVPPDDKIKVERTLGEGPESLYVYYHDSERELANLKGQSTWPCKIGKGEPIRVLTQVGTARHTPPIIALVIRSDDAEGMEKLIHGIFRRDGSGIDNEACGREWFMTTPEEVEACYLGIENLATSFRRPLADPL